MYGKILAMLDDNEKKVFFLLMVMMIFVAISEVLSITVFFVMLEVISNPDRLVDYDYIMRVFNILNIDSIVGYQIVMAITALLFIMFGLFLKTVGAYLMINFSTNQGYMISQRLYNSYLKRPYQWYLGKNSSEISKNVLSDVNRVVSAVLIPGMKILSSSILSILIITFLTISNPAVAIFCAVSIGGSYVLIYLMIKNKLGRLGKSVMDSTRIVYKVVQESTGGFKEVKLYNLEDEYSDQYKIPAQSMAENNALIEIYRELPRYLLEGITFAALLCVVMYLLINNSGDIATIIPTLGMFAFATLKLLPAIQQIYHSIAAMKSGEAVLNNIYKDYSEILTSSKSKKYYRKNKSAVNFDFQDKIFLENISFSYNGKEPEVLKNINLVINRNKSIGIVGGSGAGKSTLVDMLMGLLVPTKGKIHIDDTVLSPVNVDEWKRIIGYVPQTIYLKDDTIAANIAFGMQNQFIDYKKLHEVAKLAALYDFITDELPEGFSTQIGERGVRLSGGQRQRIGIARALYHDPKILILDEATSALDNLTEQDVVKAIDNIQGDKTVIIIAHRLTTVKKCDSIIYMEAGQIKGVGNFDQLVNANDNFKKMALYNLEGG